MTSCRLRHSSRFRRIAIAQANTKASDPHQTRLQIVLFGAQIFLLSCPPGFPSMPALSSVLHPLVVFFWCCLLVFVSPCKVLPDRRLASSNLHCSSIWPVLPSDQQQWGCMRVGQTHRTTTWFALEPACCNFGSSLDLVSQIRRG